MMAKRDPREERDEMAEVVPLRPEAQPPRPDKPTRDDPVDERLPAVPEDHSPAARDDQAPDKVLDGVVWNWQPPDIWPAWFAPGRRKAYAVHLVRYTRHMAKFHGLRSAKYLVIFVVRAAVGVSRGVRALFAWMYDLENLDVGRHSADDIRHYVILVQIRDAHVRVRVAFVGGAAFIMVFGLAVEAVMYPAALVIEGLVALAVAVWRGGLKGRDNVLDKPDLPVKLELNAEHLNAAFRAAGLLKGKDTDEDPPRLLLISEPMRERDGTSWSAVVDLPRGGGKTAAMALEKRDVIAAELGVDEIQLDMQRVRAPQGGNAGRISIWVSDDDPYLDPSQQSPLERADHFSVWEPIPYGRNARRNRIALGVMWQSMFFGGLPRRGKTMAQRLPAAAGVLDPHVRHYVADGKGGSDWLPTRAVAHRLVLGAEDDAVDALFAMLDEVIADMEHTYKKLRSLPLSVAPEAKLTPEISKRYGLPVIFVTIDELQEYLSAIAEPKRREALVERLCRITRRGPAAGIVASIASQRPDADSVPARLREIVTYRYCTHVVDRTSSDMVLGKGKAAQGADASILSEDHVGVGVLVTGPASHVIVKCDYMDVPAFAEICRRGRALREEAGTLSGDAVDDVLATAEASGRVIPQVLSDVLTVMRHSDRMWTTSILTALENLDERYGDWDADRLAAELEEAGVQRSGRQVKISGENRSGWRRADLEAAADLYEAGP